MATAVITTGDHGFSCCIEPCRLPAGSTTARSDMPARPQAIQPRDGPVASRAPCTTTASRRLTPKEPGRVPGTERASAIQPVKDHSANGHHHQRTGGEGHDRQRLRQCEPVKERQGIEQRRRQREREDGPTPMPLNLQLTDDRDDTQRAAGEQHADQPGLNQRRQGVGSEQPESAGLARNR